MSESLNDDIKRNLAYQPNYMFVFSAFPGMEYFCVNVSFPGVNIGSPRQAGPILRIPKEGDHLEFDALTLTFNIDEEYKNYFELYSRFTKTAPIENMSDHESLSDGTVIGDAKLIILSNSMNPLKVINFIGLIPISLSGFELSQQNETPEVVTATATFDFLSFDLDTETVL